MDGYDVEFWTQSHDLIFQNFFLTASKFCNAGAGDEFANNSDLITGRQLAHSRIH